jgi:2,3-bisphosphoglycerate-independent phosphoglycerate mutase
MKKAMLIIFDGFGCNDRLEFNAVRNANKPFMETFKSKYSINKLYTSGLHVGLPDGQMGNSEVGHITIGSGRIIYQDIVKINKSISDKSFFTNQTLLDAFNFAKKNLKKIHLVGLLSDGGVHSHQDHLYALLKMAKELDFPDIFAHIFLDGRDTAPNSAIKYIKQLQDKMAEIKTGKIASCGGRYFGMDRDNRWERVSLAYSAMTGISQNKTDDILTKISESYQQNIFDEFIEPFSIIENSKMMGSIEKGDIVISFNYRSDRARQLSRAFADSNFIGFERPFLDPHYVQFTDYDTNFPLATAFPSANVKHILGEVISENNLKQFRCAETEKYAHITFFFNGGEEKLFKGEDRVLIPSAKIATYDLKPEMSAFEITDATIEAINKDQYHFIALNYANSDMLGHTGNYEAALKGIEALDACLEKLIPIALKHEFEIIITADHGNAEQMLDYDNHLPFTQHTIGPVPVIYLAKNKKQLRDNGSLQDIAPTILDILGLEKPKEMTGLSLFL